MTLKLAWPANDLVENNEERLRCENITNTMKQVYRGYIIQIYIELSARKMRGER